MSSKVWIGTAVGVAAVAVVVATVSVQSAPPAGETVPSVAPLVPTSGTVKVYKSPTCGCCNEWVKHLRANGFTVETENVPTSAQLARIKADYGIDGSLTSCHTAVIDGYVIEGHVPADVIQKLLAERPNVAGLAVPGMPIGSPGMEGPNPQPYDIVTFGGEGGPTVYATKGQ